MSARNEAIAGLADADEAEAEADRLVLAAVRRLRYGEVTVTIHDGVVVQVESTERLRLPLKRR